MAFDPQQFVGPRRRVPPRHCRQNICVEQVGKQGLGFDWARCWLYKRKDAMDLIQPAVVHLQYVGWYVTEGRFKIDQNVVHVYV